MKKGVAYIIQCHKYIKLTRSETKIGKFIRREHHHKASLTWFQGEFFFQSCSNFNYELDDYKDEIRCSIGINLDYIIRREIRFNTHTHTHTQTNLYLYLVVLSLPNQID